MQMMATELHQISNLLQMMGKFSHDFKFSYRSHVQKTDCMNRDEILGSLFAHVNIWIPTLWILASSLLYSHLDYASNIAIWNLLLLTCILMRKYKGAPLNLAIPLFKQYSFHKRLSILNSPDLQYHH